MLLVAGSYTGHAQNVRFGISAGTAISNYKAKADGINMSADAIVGFTAGLLVDVPFTPDLSFQPALNLVQKGTKASSQGEENKLSTTHGELALNILYKTGETGKFFVGAGPSLSVGIGGKWKYTYSGQTQKEDVHFGSNELDDMKRFDFGANAVAGYCMENGLFFAANYNQGFSNLDPSGSGTLRSHYFGIRVGYLLGGKGK